MPGLFFNSKTNETIRSPAPTGEEEVLLENLEFFGGNFSMASILLIFPAWLLLGVGMSLRN